MLLQKLVLVGMLARRGCRRGGAGARRCSTPARLRGRVGLRLEPVRRRAAGPRALAGAASATPSLPWLVVAAGGTGHGPDACRRSGCCSCRSGSLSASAGLATARRRAGVRPGPARRRARMRGWSAGGGRQRAVAGGRAAPRRRRDLRRRRRSALRRPGRRDAARPAGLPRPRRDLERAQVVPATRDGAAGRAAPGRAARAGSRSGCAAGEPRPAPRPGRVRRVLARRLGRGGAQLGGAGRHRLAGRDRARRWPAPGRHPAARAVRPAAGRPRGARCRSVAGRLGGTAPGRGRGRTPRAGAARVPARRRLGELRAASARPTTRRRTSRPATRSATPTAPTCCVLPFSAFRAPAWNDRRAVLDPLGRYLRPDYVVQRRPGRSAETEIAGEDPRGDDVRRALDQPTPGAGAQRWPVSGSAWSPSTATAPGRGRRGRRRACC